MAAGDGLSVCLPKTYPCDTLSGGGTTIGGQVDILQEIENAHADKQPCKVARWIRTLEGDQQQQVQTALESTYSTETIFRVLRRRGGVFSTNALYKHRRGTCTCGY